MFIDDDNDKNEGIKIKVKLEQNDRKKMQRIFQARKWWPKKTK